MGNGGANCQVPLTEFQKTVLDVIRANRSPESHFAGGVVLNHSPDSPRFSKDFDIFHEAEQAVTAASEADAASLRLAGFDVLPTRPWGTPSTFRKALVTRGDGRVEIDWAADSAFRYFPIERDVELGWRLHPFDAATNKALAMGARSETRDLVDIVSLDVVYPLEAIVWAACGKDAGFQPSLLLGLMRRFAKVNPDQLSRLAAQAIDPVILKTQWTEMAVRADQEIERLADEQPDLEIGVAFVDENNVPGWIGTNPLLKIHRPSVGGCWPQFSEVE
jgi:hypothetical protein